MSEESINNGWEEVDTPRVPLFSSLFVTLLYFIKSVNAIPVTTPSANGGSAQARSAQPVSIQLPKLGSNNSESDHDDSNAVTTRISCSVEENKGIYTIYLTISSKLYILTTKSKRSADFIMKMAVNFGYFQISISDLLAIISKLMSGDNAESQAFALYIRSLFIRQHRSYGEFNGEEYEERKYDEEYNDDEEDLADPNKSGRPEVIFRHPNLEDKMLKAMRNRFKLSEK